MHSTLDAATLEKRQDFYARLAPRNLAPLWEVMGALLPPEPKSKAVPFQWRYADVRPFLVESGGLLTAEEAERRVLVLENPSFIGQSRATATLYAGIQVILPGEVAPAHRHTPSALRFMIEGEGSFTAVGGERTTMRRGDFVITPSWAFHDHGNEGDTFSSWLDGLDVPLAGYFETVFREEHNDRQQTITRPEGDAIARFGSGMLPLDGGSRYGQTTPIFNYPYERTREALVRSAQGEEPDPHTATTLRYANPIDGGWVMPTMSAWMTHLGRGFETAPMRSTDGIIMCVAEGTGTVTIGSQSFDFAPSDVIVAPGWMWRSIKAREDAFIFCFSDRVAQEKLGFFREERATPR
ncbi:MAG: gentisate 1,2-dioxygenase [Bauldia sp.]